MIESCKKLFKKIVTAATMAPLFLFILLLPLSLEVNSRDLSSEQTILLNLKQHWRNPPSLDSWDSISSPCDWPEVDCASGAVTGLFLAEKSINGTLPSSICQLKNLILINLSHNNISGYIPAALSNCSNLESLDLSANALSGTIPGEIFLMKRLAHLSLSGNRLSGEIPTPIRAQSLKSLYLSDNRLNGSIPDDIRYLHDLVQLDLSMNLFSGAIPTGLFHMRQLSYLSLGCNNLTGQLPAQMDFSNLLLLNLTHNHLRGTIQIYLGELTGLSTLDLSHNQLSGDIAENLVRLRQMSMLGLCSNEFVGKIPLEFVNQQFHERCLDPSNLCSDNGTEGLPGCPSSLCTDQRLQGFIECDRKHEESRSRFIVFVAETVGCVVVGFAIVYYLARKCRLKKATLKKIWIRGTSSSRIKEEWEMIAFHRLKFNKTDILSGLTDENLIGSGGSGKVYRVFINQTSSSVAVKSISNTRKSDHRLEKEFLAEIRTLGTIRHYNIVKLLCCISGVDLKLLAYQYFENKSLDQWLHGNSREISSVGDSTITKLDWPMRMHIAIGAAQGLCYMHHDCSPPIIHRDIKSSNILLDSHGCEYILRQSFSCQQYIFTHGCVFFFASLDIRT